MNTRTLITDEDLQACRDLKSSEDFARLVTRLRLVGAGLDEDAVLQQARSLNPLRQAKAFLLLVSLGAKPERGALLSALASQEKKLATAAAFCTAACCAEDHDLLRELLCGATSWEPTKLSKDARYWLIQFLGLSGDDRCAPVLLEALLEHAHFCYPRTTAQALEDLGVEIPPEVDLRVSIAVDLGSEGILISTDDKFSGSSNCPDCRFFPCRINHYYPGAIEDCSFWNRTDPAKAGGIRDLRSSETS